MNKVSKKEMFFYIAVGMILVAALSMLMSIKVQSKGREAVLFDNSAYMEAEAKYRRDVQEILETYEVYHSGLTMTRVVSLDGGREYDLQIYHSKLGQMEPEAFEKLQSRIGDCRVCLPDGSEYSVNVSISK